MLLQLGLPGNMGCPHFFHVNGRLLQSRSRAPRRFGQAPGSNPDATVPMPAGSSVTHFAKASNSDGAKAEQATILVWGEVPATSTPFAPPPK